MTLVHNVNSATIAIGFEWAPLNTGSLALVHSCFIREQQVAALLCDTLALSVLQLIVLHVRCITQLACCALVRPPAVYLCVLIVLSEW